MSITEHDDQHVHEYEWIDASSSTAGDIGSPHVIPGRRLCCPDAGDS